MGAAGEDDQSRLMLQLVRVVEALPDDFDRLRGLADAEGHRHMGRLADDWASGAQRFDREGEALLAGYSDGALVAVGGITWEPALAPGAALRMRRLYVAPEARRQGVAMAIANALLQEALAHTRQVTVHAGNPGADRFWDAQGYRRVEGRAWSHELLAL